MRHYYAIKSFVNLHLKRSMLLIPTLLIFSLTQTNAQNCSVNAGTGESFCQPVSLFNLRGATSGVNLDFSTITWSVQSSPSGSSPLITNPNNLSTTVKGGLTAGTYVFRLSADCSVGSTYQDVTFDIYQATTQASVTYQQTVNCYTSGDSIQLASGNSPGTDEIVRWSVSTNGEIVAGADTRNNAWLKPNFSNSVCLGSNRFYVYATYTITDTITGCSTSDVLRVRMTYMPNPISASAWPVVACGTITSVRGSCPADGTGTWTLDYSSSGATATFTNVNAQNTIVSMSDTGTFVFRWTVSGSACRNGYELTDTVYLFPCPDPCNELIPADAGEDFYFCDANPLVVSMNAQSLPSGYTGEWVQLEGDPIIVADSSDPTTLLSGFDNTLGPYTFVWQVSGPNCTSLDTVILYKRSGINIQYDRNNCYWFLENINIQSMAGTFDLRSIDTFAAKMTLISAPPNFVSIREAHALGIRDGNGSYIETVMCYDESIDEWVDDYVYDTISNLGESFEIFFGNNMDGSELWMDRHEDIALSYFQSRTYRNMTPGLYTWRVEVYDGCTTTSETATWDISIYRNGLAANAGADLYLSCGTDSAQLVGNDLSPVQTFWSYTEGPGGIIIGDSNINNQFLNVRNLADGKHTYKYIEDRGRGHSGTERCLDTEDEVSVYVSSVRPTGINAAAEDDTTCSGGSLKLYGSFGTGYSGKWSITSGPTSGTSFAPNDSAENIEVTGLTAGSNYTFRLIVSNACGTDTVFVNAYVATGTAPTPIANLDSIVCNGYGSSYWIEPAPITYGNIQWTDLDNTANIVSPTNDTTQVTSLNYGRNIFELAVSSLDPTCPYVARDTIVIWRQTSIDPVASSNEEYRLCNQPLPFSLQLDGNTVSSFYNVDLAWRMVTGPSVVTFSPKADTSDPTATFSAYGEYTLQYYYPTYGCQDNSKGVVNVTLGDSTPAAFAGQDSVACLGDGLFTLDALDIPVGTGIGYWTVESKTGSLDLTFTDVSDPNTTVDANGTGSAVVRWNTQDANSLCEAAFDEINLTYTQPVNAGNDAIICDETVATLDASPNLNGVGTTQWSKITGVTGDTIYNSGFYTTLVGNLTASSSYTYEYLTTHEGCTSRDTVEVTTSGITATPSAMVSGATCIGTSFQSIALEGSSPPSGITSFWTVNYAEPGTVNGGIENSNDSSTYYSADALQTGTYSFVYTYSDGNCTSEETFYALVEDCIQLGDKVWVDQNIDGKQTSGEVGLPGVKVWLCDNAGNPIDSMVTNAFGNYGFLDLASGNYRIKIDGSDYYISEKDSGTVDSIDSDVDQTTRITDVFFLGTVDDLTVDIGLIEKPNVGDLVWFDSNNNGVQDDGEPGATNVNVYLYNSVGTLIATTSTDISGNYIFENQDTGSYYIQVGSLPSGYRLINPDIGTNDSLDSDIDTLTHISATFNLGFQSQMFWDAGLIPNDSTPFLPVTTYEQRIRWFGNDAHIQWTTASELNNQEFQIERSLDNGRSFQYVGTVNSKASNGTSNHLLSYNYFDKQIKESVKGVVLYRIKQVDFDKNYSYSEVLLLKNNESNIYLLAYPNPAQDEVFVEFDGFESETTVELIQMDGSVLKTFESDDKQQLQIDINDVSSGVYFIKASSRHNSKIQRIIVQ